MVKIKVIAINKDGSKEFFCEKLRNWPAVDLKSVPRVDVRLDELPPGTVKLRITAVSI